MKIRIAAAGQTFTATLEDMPSHRAESMPMTLLYPHRHHLSRRVHVFVEWLESLLKREVQCSLS